MDFFQEVPENFSKKFLRISQDLSPILRIIWGTVDGKLITEPIEIVNSFNTFFSEIANNIRAKIPNTSVNPNSYTRGKTLILIYLTLIIYTSKVF